MGKQHITLKPSERKTIKQFSERKLLSHKARQQLQILLILDKKSDAIMAIAENVGVSVQTLYKWRNAFREKRLDSLIVNTEKFSETETTKRGKVKITLRNIGLEEELQNTEEINQDLKSSDTSKEKVENPINDEDYKREN